ncbi:MAG: potassium transporter Kup [Alphaproteobacteria bacterium]|nr:potassium transporter Kup [Alphaproteobacteria bacterium]MDE2336733.1 potassium transporter Kup [Alphaproteobacteria bacterium]
MQSLSYEINRKLADDRGDGHGKSAFSVLMLGALGVVYGDIGTSPLYTLQQSFSQTGLPVTAATLFPLLSMIFWLLVIVVSVKYVLFILRADNKGEGGNLALLALVLRLTRPSPRLCALMGLAGILGGSLFYADAAITPAISVLSAVEGLRVIAPELAHLVVPVTLVILVALFSVQKYGTGKMGALFGPVMLLWFGTLAVFGVMGILGAPQVLEAVNPLYALHFIAARPMMSFVAIGATMLAVTGAEALYADMGHFGAPPIRAAWFFVVWPCLVLNYFGQGALLLAKPAALANPFYLLAPAALHVPLLLLSAAATIIASQAVISGTYSITRQAMQLGFLPRMRILHTSEKELGQIYMPFVNWALLALVVFIVFVFPSSDSLASAYGLAVTGAMLITSLMVIAVMRLKWRWRWAWILATAGVFTAIDAVLFSATTTKFMSGGAMPVTVAVMIFTALTTWKKGQAALDDRIAGQSVSIDRFIREVRNSPFVRVPGTAIYMTPHHNRVPNAMMLNMRHNKMLHERVIFLTVIFEEVPRVARENRIHIAALGDDFYKMDVHYGFNDEPDIPEAMNYCLKRGMDFDSTAGASFYVGTDTILPVAGGAMPFWRDLLFAIMKQNASSAAEYYRIPADRVVEVGGRYEL